jgi:hypothetical protein
MSAPRRTHSIGTAAADLDVGDFQGGATTPPRGLEAHPGGLQVIGDELGVLSQTIDVQPLQRRRHRRVQTRLPLFELRSPSSALRLPRIFSTR